MIHKEDVIHEIKILASRKGITKEEVVAAYEDGILMEPPPVQIEEKNTMVSKILYYVGGAVVVAGIAIYAGQKWETFNSVTRIAITLGSGVAMFVSAVFLQQTKQTIGVANAFHFIGGLLIPIGLYVMLYEYFGDIFPNSVHSIVMGALMISYLVSYKTFKSLILLIFAIVFGTLFYFAVVEYIIANVWFVFNGDRLGMYEFLTVGSCYLLLGYTFSKETERRILAGFLYGFGSIFFLGSSLALGGYAPNQYIFWESIYPGFVFGGLFLSAYLRSRVMLIFSALFLMGYIGKITGEYFSNSIGWPTALILVGFTLVGVGYLTVYLNQKYISRNVV
jgi:hypothetical protein